MISKRQALKNAARLMGRRLKPHEWRIVKLSCEPVRLVCPELFPNGVLDRPGVDYALLRIGLMSTTSMIYVPPLYLTNRSDRPPVIFPEDYDCHL